MEYIYVSMLVADQVQVLSMNLWTLWTWEALEKVRLRRLNGLKKLPGGVFQDGCYNNH
jgi:hypothetical protein